jgi:hypothetical protein
MAQAASDLLKNASVDAGCTAGAGKEAFTFHLTERARSISLSRMK